MIFYKLVTLEFQNHSKIGKKSFVSFPVGSFLFEREKKRWDDVNPKEKKIPLSTLLEEVIKDPLPHKASNCS